MLDNLKHFGITATQRGLTNLQLEVAESIFSTLAERGYGWQHNGDCIGGDAQLGDIWVQYGKIYLHPPIASNKRAFLASAVADVPLDYLARNKEIVKASSGIFAFPAEMTEQLRSGTWSTVRFAIKTSKPVVIILPTGERIFGNA